MSLAVARGRPGFQGIPIHAGNSQADTDGCILPVMGAIRAVQGSRLALGVIQGSMQQAIDQGRQITIEIRIP